MKKIGGYLLITILFFLSFKIGYSACNTAVLYRVSWCQVGQQGGCSNGAWCASCAAGVYYCIRCDATDGWSCNAVCPGGEVPTCSGSPPPPPPSHPCGSCIPSSCGGGRVSKPQENLFAYEIEDTKQVKNIKFDGFSFLKLLLSNIKSYFQIKGI
jgi:hypothetical protein